MIRFWKFIKGVICLALFNYIPKNIKYDLVDVHASVHFTNGKVAHMVIRGEVKPFREAYSGDSTYMLEYKVVTGLEKFKQMMVDVENGDLDFLVSTDNTYYRLSENTVGSIKIESTRPNKVTRTVYEREIK
jgi:hypothetical protein